MKAFKLFYIILFLSSFMDLVYAGIPGKPQPVQTNVHPGGNFINHKDWSFVENKGQLLSPLQGGGGDVKYYSHERGAHVYCLPGKISFVFTKVGNDPEQRISEASGCLVEKQYFASLPSRQQHLLTKITTNRLDLILLNSNSNALITASDQQQYYENFYLAHTPEEGITNVHTYKTITYKNIYPKIDLILHSREEGMKYEFVVYPGGKVNDIQLQWAGVEKIEKLHDFGIEYSFLCPDEPFGQASGKMTETAPYTYQTNMDAGHVGPDLCVRPAQNITAQTKIQSHFVLKNNLISFKVGNYDKKKVLVIDPTLIWGTYFGGSGQDEGYGVATDKDGNVFITGQTESKSGIATNGSFQTSFGGYAFLAKFDNSGKIQWSTYYGGDSITLSYSVATYGSGNIYITGDTYSQTGITTSGAFQPLFGGGRDDAFLAKFNTSGSLLWATYFGGSAFDQAFGVCTDFSGDVYISGKTSSSSNIATKGAYQSSLAGAQDAFLAKFSSSGNIIWATYFGGNNDENNSAVSADIYGNVYISGSTGSSNGIATSGAYQTYNAGGGDAFLAKFSDSGNLLWATYYGGNDDDQAFSLKADIFGNIYITGLTLSSSGIATSGAFQTTTSGWDGFLAKFNSKGALLWATYYGGPYDTGVSGVTTDSTGNVFISGYTESKTGIATNGAYQTSLAGDFDAFLVKFDSSGNRLWASYFGIADVISNEIETGIAIDKSGNIYLTAYTISDNNIITHGAYQTSFGGKIDAFLVKFDGRPAYDVGLLGFLSPNDSVCPGQPNYTIAFMENYGYDSNFSIDFSWEINGKVEGNMSSKEFYITPNVKLIHIFDIHHIFQDNDTLVAWVHINNAVDADPYNDTAKLIIHFYKQHFAGAGQSSYTICTGTHLRIGTDGYAGNTYLWSSIPPGFTSTLSNPIVNPDSFTTFYLTETNTRTGCTNTDSLRVTVTVAKAPIVSPGFNQTICVGGSAVLGADPLGGITYSWTSNPQGFTSTSPKAGVSPDTTTTYSLTVKNAVGCTDLETVTVFVNQLPLANPGLPQKICSGTVVQLGTISVAGHTYSWTSNPVGYISTLSEPIDSPKVSTTYYLTETITATGCHKTDSVLMTVVPKPMVKILVDSIDAFTRKFSVATPNYPAYFYKWTINDSDTASGYSIIHIFKKEGSYTVKLSASIPGFCTAKDSVTGVINPPFSLNIFPNPFAVQTDIRYILPNPAHIKISIVDMLGRDVTTLLDKDLGIGEYNTGFNALSLNTRPGMYLVLFMMDNKLIVRKIVQLESGGY